MNNSIQCSIESSTTKMELNSASDGIFIVPELEGLAGLPEIRTTSGVNAGYDGGWTSAQNYDARLISIRGVIANNNIAQVEALRRKLASLLGQGRKESLTLKFVTEAGNAYSIAVRTISCEMALQRVLNKQDFLIQLRADDPLIYDDGASGGTEAILHVQQTLGGFEINFELPLAIGGGAEDTIIENGDEAVYPVINLYGPLHSPTVVNRTTNQQFQILADLGREPIYSNPISVSGNYINFEIEGEYGGAISDFKSLGNTEQTTYSGKNLLIYPYKHGTSTVDGVTFTDNGDGSITVNGTSTASTQSLWYFYENTWNYNSLSFELEAGTYTFKGLGVNNVGMACNFYFSDNTNEYFYIGQNDVTKTITQKARLNIRLVVSRGVTVNNVTIYPQIELGSTATTYEPYVGGIPAPNPEFPMPISTVTGEQTVKITGKNLLNAQGGFSNKIINSAGGESVNNHYALFDGFIVMSPSTQYTLSLNSSVNIIFVAEYDSAKTLITRDVKVNSSSYTFTTTATTKFARVFFNYDDSTTVTQTIIDGLNIQLEIGNSASLFEPYQGQSYAIDLGSIELAKIGTYQDYIWNDNGTWKIHKEVGKVVFDGSTTLTQLQASTNTTRVVATIGSEYDAPLSTVQLPLCDHFVGSSSVWATDIQGTYIQNRYAVLRANNTTVGATLDSFKTWLTSHPTTVYYVLATPTDTEITNSTLIAQLEAVASASLYSGQNNISNSSVSPNLAGDMEIEYREIDGYDVDLAVIDSQNRTVTLNGQDIYHLKTEESEFLMLAPGENKLYLTSATSDDQGYAEVKFKQGYLSI